MDNLKANWQAYLKVAGIVLAIVVWAISTQAKVEEHLADSQQSLKLLTMICKHTAKTEDERIACFEVGR